MVYAEKCVELVKEGARDTTDMILPYATNLVTEVMNEMKHLSQLLVE